MHKMIWHGGWYVNALDWQQLVQKVLWNVQSSSLWVSVRLIRRSWTWEESSVLDCDWGWEIVWCQKLCLQISGSFANELLSHATNWSLHPKLYTNPAINNCLGSNKETILTRFYATACCQLLLTFVFSKHLQSVSQLFSNKMWLS